MPAVVVSNGKFTVKAYAGDAKTLLAFNLDGPSSRRLAGFTIRITPPGVTPYYLQNDLKFEHPENHAQDDTLSAFASINAPIHKFRWVHVPGVIHQGLDPQYGNYRYDVTPRYFDTKQSLLPLDAKLTATVEIDVNPLKRGKLKLGFTRGFVQSQAFTRRFGENRISPPRDAPLLFDTSQVAGTNPHGDTYTYQDQYKWLGFTARERVFELIKQVMDDPSLALDLFAYDLREPDFMKAMIELGRQKRARIILDDAALHHDKTGSLPEDQFEKLFAKAAGVGAILRGNFGRYSHDKIILVRDNNASRTAHRVLTGSTNFAVTGFYVNSNHVLVFDDAAVAGLYGQLFDQCWKSACDKKSFADSTLGTQPSIFAGGGGMPKFSVTFSPHSPKYAAEVLDVLIARINEEAQAAGGRGSVIFAVMELGGAPKPNATPAQIAKRKADNPVYAALNTLHANPDVFSFGISDNPEGIVLYRVGMPQGVIVTGKPGKTRLPPPFSQVAGIGGGHQIHHKFVVCGFNGPDPTVFCGSSNLALGGEEENGDNLLAIRDEDVATAFAIEGLALVDHFNFLDSLSAQRPGNAAAPAAASGTAPLEARTTTAPPTAAADKRDAAAQSGWFLGTTDAWAKKYFDPKDLHCRDRVLFAG